MNVEYINTSITINIDFVRVGGEGGSLMDKNITKNGPRIRAFQVQV